MPIMVDLIPDPEQGGYTACVPDIPAYGEGATREEAISDLQEALRGYIETWGLEDALSRMTESKESQQVEWDLAELTHG